MNSDFAVFVLRVAVGSMMVVGHGWNKLINFSNISSHFPDPLGLGSTASLALATFAEFFCSALVVLGIGTRLAAIPPFLTMVVAAGLFHLNDPWSKKELAIMYAVAFFVLMLTGGGRFGLGSKLKQLDKYN